jgi:hypothetical protein
LSCLFDLNDLFFFNLCLEDILLLLFGFGHV